MKRLLLLTTVIFALVMGGFHQWKAHADEAYSPGCGSNPSKYAEAYSLIYGSGGFFRTRWNQDCNTGPFSVEVEVQRSQDNGLHWNDVVVNGYTLDSIFPTNTAGPDSRYHDWPNSACGSGLYREKVWAYYGGTTALLIDTGNGAGVCP